MIRAALLVTVAAAAIVALNYRPAITGPAYTIDGDTIAIGRTQIRLGGVDAPELSMAGGMRSREVMREIVGGQEVTCVPNGDRSYNRVISICHLPDGTDIGRELIRRGLALDCAHFSGGRYRNDEPAGVRQRLTQARYC